MKYVVVFCLLFLSKGFAQNITYDYDDAGNRILRHVVHVGAKVVQGSEEDKPDLEPIELSKQVVIYPNPVLTSLKIQNDLEQASFNLIDTKGNSIVKGQLAVGVNEVDFTSIPKGSYLLLIANADHHEKVKLIKH